MPIQEHPVINGTFTKIGHFIPTQRVVDLLIGAIEGGSNYWYSHLICDLADGLKYEDFRHGGKFVSDDNYYHPLEIVPFVDGCALILHVMDDSEVYRIDKASLKTGLEKMAQESKEHWANFISEDDDAETADVFLQYVVFGEIIYG